MTLIPRARALGYSYVAPTALEPRNSEEPEEPEELRGTPGELRGNCEEL
jgi:hypothetical protein